MKKIALASFILCLYVSPAPAQENQYTGGMKYTTMGASQNTDSQKKPIYNRAPLNTEESNAPKDALPDAEAAAIEKPQEETIWDKYRALAEGKANPAEDSSPQKPEKPHPPSKQAQSDDEPKATGFSSIIENYQRSKEKRGQMKSITFTKPEVNTPEVEKPKVAAPKVENSNAKATPSKETDRSAYN